MLGPNEGGRGGRRKATHTAAGKRGRISRKKQEGKGINEAGFMRKEREGGRKKEVSRQTSAGGRGEADGRFSFVSFSLQSHET